MITLSILSVTGCATSSSNLKLEDLDSEHGAFFGHLKVMNEGEEVTSSCYAEFTDQNDHRKRYVNLDKTGYVFGAVKPGPTYLSTVICTLGGLVKYNATYQTRDLEFNVASDRTIAYFGHVTVDLKFDSSGMTATTLLAGSVGNAIASSAKSGHGGSKVENKFEIARQELEKRFSTSLNSLNPTVALASPPTGPKSRLPASAQRP